jgi:uncharacterized protein (DUF1330 family)
MAAYAIAEVDVSDVEMFKVYMDLVPKTVENFGGKYLVRGGATSVIEGAWRPKRLVIIEFENVDKAMEWYNSDEYSRALKVRHNSSATNLVFIEGVT